MAHAYLIDIGKAETNLNLHAGQIFFDSTDFPADVARRLCDR